MNVFNPKILDASIRDVSTCLTENQKVDLLLYALKSLQFEGRSRTVIHNAIQSCLQVATLSPETVAKARILRARARLASGSHFSAQEDLTAALVAEPDNPEAKALLHQRSVAVEKLLAPLPQRKAKFSNEIWREIALFLPRRDLKTLLFIPHAISRVASQLLFRELDLHFCGPSEEEESHDWSTRSTIKDEDARHAQRSADILTRIIVDPAFASCVRTLKIYAPWRDRDGCMAFQTGMLTNALPKLINMRNVHICAGSESIICILRILQVSSPRLRGLSLSSPDSPADISVVELRHLTHFAYSTMGGNQTHIQNFISQNRDTLRTISLDNPNTIQNWTFPTQCLSIRNLTSIDFAGHFLPNSNAFADILTNGRQLESLKLTCYMFESTAASQQFRCLQNTNALPFLRHFAFSVHAVGRRVKDRDLFPAVADFVRGRVQLRTIGLVASDIEVQRAIGFDAAIWGVLPSLLNLRGLTITYPNDLSPGLASWLIPRSLFALELTLDGVGLARDPIPFLSQLRPGIPQGLRYVGVSELPPRNAAGIIEHGFPMVRVLRMGSMYWTVAKKEGLTVGGSNTNNEVEPWPKRRVLYHTAEWLEWLGCEDAPVSDPSSFRA
ncbi:hypothetical protein BDQ12DRAFT_712664 [Crucibulum laeve]|uniref:Uncharacterized protein n=1 Tax=Crucibulum laeve TaxID=68775 RepID=A0A5C3M0N3_9AGAR|nr:hypothetical protein BDQ12DRAFT_712664 [Crucibulum laeve]